ncbi:cupin domain-containing protein [Streptomyces noursei]|uniref:cupin domain-containing protein n=1 Tax=Streptomyces noursei TaxID=1971 RepID=UPI0023B8520D|nr:cupin domain-containing protein [Streptomyces noursei]
MSYPPIQRVVTELNAQGESVISSAGRLPTVVKVEASGATFHEIWTTAADPLSMGDGSDSTTGPLMLAPPSGGSVFRIVDFPPESEQPLDLASAREAFAEIGGANAFTGRAESPHPAMHRTETVDYGVVISGEITLVVGNSEVVLRPGHTIVQRGTDHAWVNRTDEVCRIAFVQLDATTRHHPTADPHPADRTASDIQLPS